MPPQPTCSCGACKKCRRRRRNKDRYLNESGFAEKSRESSRKWRERSKQKGYSPLVRDKKYVVDPVKRRAWRMVRNEIKYGRMIPERCEICGKKAQAHHDDYSKPLDVRWLCMWHHKQHHRIHGYH